MSQTLWEKLERHGIPSKLAHLSSPLGQKLRGLSEDLDLILGGSDEASRTEIVTKLYAEIFRHVRELEAAQFGAPLSEPLPPEILEWARREFNEEQVVAGIREIEEKGGFQLGDFIHELEQEETSP
jgi:hypothetical protein